MKDTILCLCDLTGVMAQPWVDAGYRAILVDPQHPEGVSVEGSVTKVGRIIDHPATWQVIRENADRIAFVAAFPVCTEFAVSGAAHWERKYQADRYFQAKATRLPEQCKTIAEMIGAPYFLENPVSAMSSIFGRPDHMFHPYEYGGYLPEDDQHPQWPEHIKPRDAYPKKTCLWVGGGFLMPERRPVDVDAGFSDQYKKLGGKSEKTKNIRSATPRGFARAVFEANR